MDRDAAVDRRIVRRGKKGRDELMDNHTMDVIVVGGGIMGASATWHLARAGVRVALLEQFELAHTRGSSHGAARIFRLAYDEPDYVRLAVSALQEWREAEKALGRELLWTTGGVDIGPPAHLQGVMHGLGSANCPYEYLDRDDASRRFPWLTLPEDWAAVYQGDAGVLNADACRLGLAELARNAGAEIRERTRVDRLVPQGDGVVAETDAGHWTAEHVILATAGWSNRLLAPLGLDVPMRVTREQVAYFPYRGKAVPLPFICHGGASSFDFYGLPNWHTGELKLGKHGAGPDVDPDSEAVVDQERLAEVYDFVREHLPVCGSTPVRSETCLYASTPDDDFVLDRIGRIVLGIGFGGHGFKFGAIIGRILADIARGEIAPFAPRFAHQRFAVASHE